MLLPGAGDGQEVAGRLDTDEEGLTVGAEGGAGELAVVEVVAGEGVGHAVGGDAESVLDALAVLGRDDAAVGRDGDVVGTVVVVSVLVGCRYSLRRSFSG